MVAKWTRQWPPSVCEDNNSKWILFALSLIISMTTNDWASNLITVLVWSTFKFTCVWPTANSVDFCRSRQSKTFDAISKPVDWQWLISVVQKGKVVIGSARNWQWQTRKVSFAINIPLLQAVALIKLKFKLNESMRTEEKGLPECQVSQLHSKFNWTVASFCRQQTHSVEHSLCAI